MVFFKNFIEFLPENGNADNHAVSSPCTIIIDISIFIVIPLLPFFQRVPPREMRNHTLAEVRELFASMRALAGSSSSQNPMRGTESSEERKPRWDGRLQDTQFFYETFHNIDAIVLYRFHR